MPKGKRNLKGLDSKEGQRTLIKAFKVTGGLRNIQAHLENATFDFYTSLTESIETETVNRQSNLYFLSCDGAEVFSDHKEKLVQRTELFGLILKLAAFCFPYSPTFNIPIDIYFNFEKSCLLALKTRNYWSAYFFFLKEIISDDVIEFYKRISYLCGALKFFVINSRYLTYDFVENTLNILNLRQTIELWQKAKNSGSSVDSYDSNYGILLDKSEEFWNKRGIQSQKKEDWIIFLRERRSHFIALEKEFIEQHHLAPVSFLDREIEGFVNTLSCFMDGLNQEESKKICEKLFIFLDNKHALFLLFSQVKLRKKVDLVVQKNEQLIRHLVMEEDNRQAITQKINEFQQLKRAKIAEQAQILQEKRRIEKKNKENRKKIEEKRAELNEQLHHLFKTLQNSASYIRQFGECYHKKARSKLEQQVRTELGKFRSELEEIYKTLGLISPHFSEKKGLLYYLVEIENKMKVLHLLYLDNEKNSLLKDKMSGIQEVIKVLQWGVEKKLQELGGLIDQTDGLKSRVSVIFEVLENKRKPSVAQISEFNQCKKEIKELEKRICVYITTLEAYNAIILVPFEYKEVEQISQNISSLEKIFKAFSAEMNKDTSLDRNDRNTCQKHRQVFFQLDQSVIPDREQDAENRWSLVVSWYLIYINWERGFKVRFLKTLEVIHRISCITFEQGRTRLAAIFIDRLKAYRKEAQKEQEKLLTYKNNIVIERELESKCVWIKLFEEEINELESKINDPIDYLISIVQVYGLAQIEFYRFHLDNQALASQLLMSFESTIFSTRIFEKECTDLKIELLELLSQRETENFSAKKRRLFEKRMQLSGQYQRVGQLNKKLHRIFVANQLNDHSVAIDIPHVDQTSFFPLAAPVIAIPWIPIDLPFTSVGFFVHPVSDASSTPVYNVLFLTK